MVVHKSDYTVVRTVNDPWVGNSDIEHGPTNNLWLSTMVARAVTDEAPFYIVAGGIVHLASLKPLHHAPDRCGPKATPFAPAGTPCAGLHQLNFDPPLAIRQYAPHRYMTARNLPPWGGSVSFRQFR
jgi:hypothetical protein